MLCLAVGNAWKWTWLGTGRLSVGRCVLETGGLVERLPGRLFSLAFVEVAWMDGMEWTRGERHHMQGMKSFRSL